MKTVYPLQTKFAGGIKIVLYILNKARPFSGYKAHSFHHKPYGHHGGYLVENIEITHVFSCINNCRVPEKLFEHEDDRPSIQTSPEGPGKC